MTLYDIIHMTLYDIIHMTSYDIILLPGQAAIECDGSDATSMHLLGQWCYSVVSVPWYQRQVATVLFATPPHSTYEEVKNSVH